MRSMLTRHVNTGGNARRQDEDKTPGGNVRWKLAALSTGLPFRVYRCLVSNGADKRKPVKVNGWESFQSLSDKRKQVAR